MNFRNARLAVAALSASLATGVATGPVFAQAPSAPPPIIQQDARMQVSEHVHVIPDDYVGFVPNVGIVVGERATLIVDTGLGERNGAIVLGEAREVSDNTEFYLTATHFHPEHDLGAEAFPPNAKMLRWVDQQAEAEELGAETIERFSGFSPIVAELLDGVALRAPDIVFDDEIVVDLGGVHVRIFGVGPNHTRGDTAFFVVEDGVLFTGDTVMGVFPSVSAQAADLEKWQDNLNDYEAFDPLVVVPAHGKLGDVAMIRRYREYLSAVELRTAAAKRAGKTLEAATAELGEAFAREFSDLAPANGSPTGRINAAIQAAYREAD